ncbi:hypothetical protein [Gracilibacillus oryzae]|nr:hypothetical protein [Gracilibacillus oryzae]
MAALDFVLLMLALPDVIPVKTNSLDTSCSIQLRRKQFNKKTKYIDSPF